MTILPRCSQQFYRWIEFEFSPGTFLSQNVLVYGRLKPFGDP